MSDAPLVSVVIPTYNLGRYLGATIDSILAQDYRRVELIVIDDGSTDNTRDILASYGDRLRWQAQPNSGQVAALNRGWRLSRGEILSWIGADDLLLPNAVSTSVKWLAERPDVVLTYCDFNLIDSNSLVIRHHRTPDFSYYDMVVRVICPPGPGAFFRRAAFEATGRWDDSLRVMLDYDYWLRLGLQGPFVRIPEVLALYRIHAGQETFSTMDARKSAEPVRVVTRLFETHVLPPEVVKARDRALSNAHLVSAQLNFRGGRYRLGLASLRTSFSLWPGNFLARRTFRMAANVLFNRSAYKVMWRINNLLRR